MKRRRKSPYPAYIAPRKSSRGPLYWGVGVLVLVVAVGGGFVLIHTSSRASDLAASVSSSLPGANTSPSIATPDQATTTLPAQKELEDGYYVGQTFNNCGPSALSMDLSFYGINVSQAQIASDLRPDNNTTGKDDDKSTAPEEIAAEAEKFGLTAYYRPDGSINELETFIANGIPVLVRTQFIPSEDYAHYRVIKGYDQATGEIIDEDGFTGPEVHFTYDQFLALWKPYNYEYIVLVPPGKEALVQSILGEDSDVTTAWQNAATAAQQALAQNPNDVAAGLDLSVALYHTGDYQGSVTEFEKVQPLLTEHALWYQLEPIEAYLQLGNDAKVISLSESILNDNNPAYPELYVLMGQALQQEGNTAAAKTDFETALQYNKNLASAQEALASL